jgi:hypothetical protein
MGEDKVAKNRIRRRAARQGLSLRKSRRRDELSFDYGQWEVIDREGRVLKILDNTAEVEQFLSQRRER